MARESELAKKPQTQSLVQSDQRPTITPACDIFENQNEILVVADLPGVTPESLAIHLDKGELSVEGRREVNAQEGAAVATEYPAADYRRRFAVPNGIDGDKIHAQLTNGVLTLRLPKSEALKPREIKVRAG
jgi:HSP20 family molecular chaperone IbpA